MADLTVATKRETRGDYYYQKTGNSADASSGIAVVPALAKYVGVLDDLIVTADATEDITLKAGSDFLMQDQKTTAEMLTVDCLPGNKFIRSDTVGEAITLVVSAGQMHYTAWYHYELAGDQRPL